MRIASLAPSVTTMLQELGAGDQIVACTHLCPLPKDIQAQLAVGSFASLDKEKLLATKPDLIVTATLVQARGSAALTAEGLAVLHLDPRSLADIADSYALLGDAVGRRSQGRQLQDALRTRVAELAAQPQPRRRLTIYMEEWHKPPFVAGNWVPDLVALAGGDVVLAASGEASREITLAELIAVDPDVIVQHICLPLGRDWTAHRQRLAEQLRQRPGWDALRAVRQGRVYSMDDSPFNMPTSGIVEGVALLQSVISAVAAV